MTNLTDELIRGLADGNLEIRRQAAEQLATLAEVPGDAAPALIQAAGDADDTVRELSVSALESMGSPPVGLQPVLVKLLSSSEDDSVYWAATLLGRSKSADESVTKELIAILQTHRSQAVRERVAWALGEASSPNEEVRSALEAAAQERTPRLAREAKRAIAKLKREL